MINKKFLLMIMFIVLFSSNSLGFFNEDTILIRKNIGNATYNFNYTYYNATNYYNVTNQFNQVLNTTSHIIFASLNLTGNLLSTGFVCDIVGCIPNMTNYYNKTEVDSLLNGSRYLPTSFSVIYATIDVGNLSSLYYPEDGNTLNVSEASGVNAMVIYTNFSNVTSFNAFEIRYRYSDGGGHVIVAEFYDYETSSWEGGYLDIMDTNGNFQHLRISVLDDDEHIQGGVVQFRLRHQSLGNPSHDFFYDQINLVDGLGGGSLKDGTGGWVDDGVTTTTSRDVLITGVNTTLKINNKIVSPVGENYPQRCEEDFITTTTNKGCWVCGGITGAVGTQSAGNGEPNHVGIINFRSLANTPNSGYYCVASATTYDIEGGEEYTAIFKTFLDTTNNSLTRLGFFDIFTVADTVDSIEFVISANTTDSLIRGRTQNNNAETYTLNYSLNTVDWYKAYIKVADNLNNVTFKLYNSSNCWYNSTISEFECQLLFNQSLSTNIPSTSARLTGNGILAYSTANTTLQNIVTIDYMMLDLNRRLYR